MKELTKIVYTTKQLVSDKSVVLNLLGDDDQWYTLADLANKYGCAVKTIRSRASRFGSYLDERLLSFRKKKISIVHSVVKNKVVKKTSLPISTRSAVDRQRKLASIKVGKFDVI